jgi:hypothetical protein
VIHAVMKVLYALSMGFSRHFCLKKRMKPALSIS